MLKNCQKILKFAAISRSLELAQGITLAIELARYFKDVLLLELGGLEFEQETQDLYDGVDLEGMGTLRLGNFLAVDRLRFFGGTTNHWTGLCAPFDPVDFERIADQPYSGWPFQLDSLVPFYERAYSYCEIGTYQKLSPVISSAAPIASQILDNTDFQLAEFRHSPPTRLVNATGQRSHPQIGLRSICTPTSLTYQSRTTEKLSPLSVCEHSAGGITR